jgi:methionine-rich copper-binding protein CopC
MNAAGRVAALALTLLLAAVGAGPAAAHTELVATTPRDGETVASAPAAIELVFSGALQPEFTQLVVTGGDGGRLNLAAPEVSDTTVRQSMPAVLAAGRLVVAYRVVAADGHPITGQISFTYAPVANATPAAATARAAASTPAAPPVGDTGTDWEVWAWLVGGALLVGAGLVTGLSRRAR